MYIYGNINNIYIYIRHHPVFARAWCTSKTASNNRAIEESLMMSWEVEARARWDPHGHPPPPEGAVVEIFEKMCHSKLTHKLKNNAWKEYFFPFGKASFRRFGRVDDLTVHYLSKDIVRISQTASWILLRTGFSYQNLADTLNTPSSWRSSIHITQDTKLFGIMSPLSNWLINMTI